MMSYIIGDRVQVCDYNVQQHGLNFKGNIGTVVNKRADGHSYSYCVLLDGKANRETLSGGFWFDEYMLTPYGGDTEAKRDEVKLRLNMIYGVTGLLSTDIRNCIKDVIFNDRATIVFWSDNTKTVVKRSEMDDQDPEKGLAMCICKKVFGNKGNYYEVFKKLLPKEEENESDLPKIAFKPETWTFDLKPIDINRKLFRVFTGTNDKTTIKFEDAKEESKRNPVEEAYKKLVEHRDGDGKIDLDELIGLLGEALDS